MPDDDPFAAIARPIVPPKANADPYASIAKPIDPYASIAKPINFDDLYRGAVRKLGQLGQ